MSRITKKETSQKAGNPHAELLLCEPSQRSKSDLSFDGDLLVVSVERLSLSYEIAANLPLVLDKCPHCGASHPPLHGRYVIRLADLPYVDNLGRAMPVQYAITAQRYQCDSCNRGVVEPLPKSLKPTVTNARITKRLYEWLLYEIQTESSYETIARMTGYSKIWVRKWFQDVRLHLGLPPKSSKPGPRKKIETTS